MRELACDRAKTFAKFYVSRYGNDAVKQATLRIAGLGINPSKRDRLMWRDVIAEIKDQKPDDSPATSAAPKAAPKSDVPSYTL